MQLDGCIVVPRPTGVASDKRAAAGGYRDLGDEDDVFDCML